MWCLEIPAGKHHVQLKNGFQGAGAMTPCVKPFPHSMRFRVQTPRTCVEARKYGNCLFFQHLGARNKIPGVSWLARQAKLYERSHLSKQSGEWLRLRVLIIFKHTHACVHSTDVHVQKKSSQWWLKGKEREGELCVSSLSKGGESIALSLEERTSSPTLGRS